MDYQKTPIKENGSSLNGESSGTGLNQLSPPKDGSYGAAFSLASLDQGNNRSGGSLLNLSNFDTGVFLKSGSFDSLHTLLGSQFFKQEADKQAIPPLSSTTPSLLNTSSSALNSLPNIGPSASNLKSMLPTPIPSNVISTTAPQSLNSGLPSNQLASISNSQPYGNNALIQPKDNDKRIVEKKDDNSKFVDVTPFLTLPQHEAAKKLGIPSSTLAKRWKEASCNRKWPYRTVSKLDKEILTLLKNVESAKAELSPSVEATLGLLLKKRNEELKTVLVRL